MNFYFNYFLPTSRESKLIVTSRCHALAMSFPENVKCSFLPPCSAMIKQTVIALASFVSRLALGEKE